MMFFRKSAVPMTLTLGICLCVEIWGGCRKSDSNAGEERSPSATHADPAGANVSEAEGPPPDPPGAEVSGNGGSRSPGDALAAAERDIAGRWDKVQSYSAEVTTSTEFGPADARRILEGLGTRDYMKRDGQALVRMEVVGDAEAHAVGKPSVKKKKTLTIVDGEFRYMLTESGGKLNAHRLPLDPRNVTQVGGRELLDRLHEHYQLKLLPSETLDGRPAYAIECTSPELSGRMVHYFDKESGIMTKLVVEIVGGQRRTMTFRVIKTNPTFSDDHFVFTPPRGVQMTDLSGPDRSDTAAVPTPVP